MSIFRHCPASSLALYYGIVIDWQKLNRNLIIPGEVEVAIVKSTPEEALEAADESRGKAPSPKLVAPLQTAAGWGCSRKGQNCHAYPSPGEAC